MPHTPVLKLGPGGAINFDGQDMSLKRLEVRLERDKAQKISTPISVHVPTNVDWTHIGPVMDLARSFDRQVDAVMGN